MDQAGQVGGAQVVGEVLPVDGRKAEGVQASAVEAAKVVPEQVLHHRVRDGGGLLELLHVDLVVGPLQPPTGGGAAVDEDESLN